MECWHENSNSLHKKNSDQSKTNFTTSYKRSDKHRLCLYQNSIQCKGIILNKSRPTDQETRNITIVLWIIVTMEVQEFLFFRKNVEFCGFFFCSLVMTSTKEVWTYNTTRNHVGIRNKMRLLRQKPLLTKKDKKKSYRAQCFLIFPQPSSESPSIGDVRSSYLI